jgi:2-keto-4-pentenoate hydratase/2-oxohepta-3-ene-1,7-dioic acid hydratase in catechol pathway
MLLVTFAEGSRQAIGALDRNAGQVVDFSQAAPQLPADMLGFIRFGAEGLTGARAAVASGTGRLPADSVRLLAPLPRPPRNILCVGKNYRDHAKEVKSLPAGSDDIPKVPIFFTKATSSVIGPGEAIPSWLDPRDSTDYEGELGVVIGAGGRGISREEAMDHVYGYTIVNDATSRGLQREHAQWFLGKSLDGYCPMGPAILTADEVPDVDALQLQTRVNGELRQNGRLADLIFDIPNLIETLSSVMRLEPGDVIATGTPAGVGMGFKPPKFLHKGDVVAITIEPVGTLENPVE